MQPQHPTKFAPLSGRLICAMYILSALTLSFTTASAGDGLGMAGQTPTDRAHQTPTDSESIAFDSAQAGLQRRLVDLAKATLPATVIDFRVDGPQPLRLDVYDLQGQHVRTLAEGLWAGGNHRMAWHHETDDGDLLKQGTYVVRLNIEADPAHEMARGR